MIQAKAKLTSVGTLELAVETGSGHKLVIDDLMGRGAPKPIELLAAVLAGCAAFNMLKILRAEKQQNVTAYEVSVEAEQKPAPPRVFIQVRIHHPIGGHDIDPQSVKDAIWVSETKHNSVEATIFQSGAGITTSYSIHPAAPSTGKGAE